MDLNKNKNQDFFNLLLLVVPSGDFPSQALGLHNVVFE